MWKSGGEEFHNDQTYYNMSKHQQHLQECSANPNPNPNPRIELNITIDPYCQSAPTPCWPKPSATTT